MYLVLEQTQDVTLPEPRAEIRAACLMVQGEETTRARSVPFRLMMDCIAAPDIAPVFIVMPCPEKSEKTAIKDDAEPVQHKRKRSATGDNVSELRRSSRTKPVKTHVTASPGNGAPKKRLYNNLKAVCLICLITISSRPAWGPNSNRS
jgi:hypothetical protein